MATKPGDPEWEWRMQLTSLVAEVKTNQENMSEKIDTYIAASNKRMDDLEHVVYGNGSEGLTETVRNMKGKWAIMYGLAIICLSAGLNAAAKELLTVLFR